MKELEKKFDEVSKVKKKCSITHVQYRSNVSYHLSSCFSRDASCFSRDESRFLRDASRFARESLKRLVWNIFYMYYSQEASEHIKDVATILTCKHQQKVRSTVHCSIQTLRTALFRAINKTAPLGATTSEKNYDQHWINLKQIPLIFAVFKHSQFEFRKVK